MNSGVGSFKSHKNQVSESARKQDLRFLSLSEKTRKSNHLQIVFAKAALSPQLKILSVVLAGVWTHDLPLSRSALSQLN